MILQLFKKKKEVTFDRTYAAPIDRVWEAWTQADQLQQWWGPEKTSIPECEVDLRVGGQLRVVMEAGEAMGKYAGTRWAMEATCTRIDTPHHLAYDARSWTEGEEDTAVIEHTNELTLTADGDTTVMHLQITITAIGSGAKMAAFGMKWGYKAQLDKLETHLAG